MQVILLEKIRNLGNLGDAVTVKAGYARNYLLPQEKAMRATAENIKLIEKRRAELEKKAVEELAQAQLRADQLNALKISIQALASDEGKLYGSVGTTEISNVISATGHEVSKREILLPEGPIHSVGEFEVQVQIHSEVIAIIKLEIVAIK